MHSETLIADPIKSFKEKKERCRQKKDTRMPSAHLPIKTPTNFSTSKHKLFISESHDMFVRNVSWNFRDLKKFSWLPKLSDLDVIYIHINTMLLVLLQKIEMI